MASKGNSQVVRLKQELRGGMILAARDLWTLGAPLVASVRVVVTFLDGEQIAQERAVNGWSNAAGQVKQCVSADEGLERPGPVSAAPLCSHEYHNIGGAFQCSKCGAIRK